MKVQYFISFVIFFIFSCRNIEKSINVLIENNSDLNEKIDVAIYVNDSLVDNRSVNRNSIADSFLPFKIGIENEDKKVVLKFILSENEMTSCIVNADSICERTLVHVNYVEKLFKKGYEFNKTVLLKDSIIRKDFYCEIMYQGMPR